MTKEMYERMEKQYREALKQNIERSRKQHKKEKMLSILIGAFIIVATSVLIIVNADMQKKAVDNCQSKGHSYNYCVNKLG